MFNMINTYWIGLKIACIWLCQQYFFAQPVFIITGVDKGMGGRYVDFLYTICRYIATIHTDIVDKLTRSVEIVSQKNGHYFLNQHYLYKDRLYLLVRQDLLK